MPFGQIRLMLGDETSFHNQHINRASTAPNKFFHLVETLYLSFVIYGNTDACSKSAKKIM